MNGSQFKCKKSILGGRGHALPCEFYTALFIKPTQKGEKNIIIIKFVLLIIYYVTHICIYINYCTRSLLENNELLLREIKERKGKERPYNTPDMVLYIRTIFLHSMKQKSDQGTLGTQRSPLGLGAALVLQWILPWP